MLDVDRVWKSETKPGPSALSTNPGAEPMPPNDWTELARAAAKDAHENFFHYHHGIMPNYTGLEVLVLYNNLFSPDYPTLQDIEREVVTRRLSEEGIGVLGSATYPTSGEYEGYSYALIIDADEEDLDRVGDIEREVHLWALLNAESLVNGHLPP
jgi:hypothetical protein